MKKLFMVIFIPVLIIVGVPALGAAIMYDGSGDDNMPTHLYTEDADAKNMVYTELSDSIDDFDDDITTNLVYNLHQDVINTAIFEYFTSEEVNPDYMPTDDCEEDSCNYVFSDVEDLDGFGLGYRIVGAWVDFADDKFITNIFLEISLNDGFTYKTTIQIHFDFLDLPEKYELEFNKIQIGNLPVPKSLISSILGVVDKQISQIDLEDMSSSVPIGDLDVTNVSYTIMKDDILAELQANQGDDPDTGAVLAQEVLSIIFDKGLVTFVLQDEELVLTAEVSKFESTPVDIDGEPIPVDIPLYLYEMHDTNIVDGVEVIGDFNPLSFDIESYLADKFTEYVFNYALAGGTGFTINERTFNKMIYYSTEGFSDTRTTYEYENDLGEIEVIDIGLKAIWFELDEDEIYINALFKVAGIDSILEIKAIEQSTSATELVFVFTDITFGKDEGEPASDFLDIENIELFIGLLEDLEGMEFGDFSEGVLTISAESLTDLMQDGSAEDVVTVNGIYLVQDAIVLDVTPMLLDAELMLVLDEFSDALNTVLEGDLLATGLEEALDVDNPGPEQDVYNDIVDIQTALTDGDSETNVDAEQITDMFTSFEEMDAEAQQAFLDTFEGLIPESIYDAFNASYTSGDETEE